jgi:tetratricopeptide (TPR) repeat protein
MRAVVREPGGLLGSADRKLDVRGMSGPDVTASDIILTSASGSLPVRARAYTEDGLSGMLEAYGRAPQQLEDIGVTAALVPVGSDRPIATVRGEAGTALSTGTGVMRRANFAIPLTGVLPGAYLARVKLTAGAETVADLTREVEIVSGRAPAFPPASAPTQSTGSFGEASPRTGSNPPPEIRTADILNGDFVRRTRATLREAASAGAVRATKGFELFAARQYELAVVELAEALRLEPAQAGLAFVLGWAHEGAGDRRQAIGAWRAAAVIDPRMVPAHLALADAYLRMLEPGLAAQAIRAGLAALPDSPELLTKLAEIERKE